MKYKKKLIAFLFICISILNQSFIYTRSNLNNKNTFLEKEYLTKNENFKFKKLNYYIENKILTTRILIENPKFNFDKAKSDWGTLWDSPKNRYLCLSVILASQYNQNKDLRKKTQAILILEKLIDESLNYEYKNDIKEIIYPKILVFYSEENNLLALKEKINEYLLFIQDYSNNNNKKFYSKLISEIESFTNKNHFQISIILLEKIINNPLIDDYTRGILLGLLSDNYWFVFRYDLSLEKAISALESFKKTNNLTINYLNAYYRLGKIYSNKLYYPNQPQKVIFEGNYKKAEKYFNKALDIYESILERNKYVNKRDKIFYGLLDIYYKDEQFTKLDKLINTIEENISDESSIEYATYNMALGSYSQFIKGNHVDSLKYFEKALKIYEKEFGKENIKTKALLHGIANNYLALGYLDKALSIYEESLPKNTQDNLKELAYNSLRLDTFGNLNVAFIKALRQDFPSAEKVAEKMLERYKNFSNQFYFADKIEMLLQFGYIYNSFGLNDKALEFIDKAIDLNKIIYSPDSITTFNILSVKNKILLEKNLIEDAISNIKIQEKIIENTKLKQSDKEGYFNRIYSNIADIEIAKGDFQKALFYEKKIINNPNHVKLSQIHYHLGNNLESKKYIDKAEKFFEETNTKETLGYNEFLVVKGFIFSKNKDQKNASNYFRKSIKNDVINIQKQIIKISNNKRINFSLLKESIYDSIYNLASKNNIYNEIALFARINRNGLKQEIEKKQNIFINTSKELMELKENLLSLNLKLENNLNNIEASLIKEKIEEIEEDIFLRIPEIKPEIISIMDISKNLNSNELLIEFKKYTNFRKNENSKNNSVQKYMMLTLDNNGEVNSYDLGESDLIDNKILLTNNLLEKSWDLIIKNPTESSKLLKKSNQISQELINKIFKPLYQFKNKEKLYVSLDADLNNIAFTRLLALKEKDINLFNKLNFITSAKDLLRRENINKTDMNESLIVANPNFDFFNKKNNTNSINQKRSLNLNKKVWGPLPYTQREGRFVSKILEGKLLTGNKATAKNIQEIISPKNLHIASHSFYIPQKDTSNYLFNSGIVLAGANNANKNISDDGYLTSQEITKLDLRGTDLVVISGCQSGIGSVLNGEGIYGLKRSFKVAGARSSLMSLWKVDDMGTALYMEDFYKNLQKYSNKKAAQYETIKKFINHPLPIFRHPYVWAAFQLSGDWQKINFD